jgi:hypothetical protein
MASVTKYPGTVSQTTGGHYVSWDNLENIKTAATKAGEKVPFQGIH